MSEMPQWAKDAAEEWHRGDSSAIKSLSQTIARHAPLEQMRELELRNQSQADSIGGYCKLISAAKDLGVDFWWDGETAKADYSLEQKQQVRELVLAAREYFNAYDAFDGYGQDEAHRLTQATLHLRRALEAFKEIV